MNLYILVILFLINSLDAKKSTKAPTKATKVPTLNHIPTKMPTSPTTYAPTLAGPTLSVDELIQLRNIYYEKARLEYMYAKYDPYEDQRRAALANAMEDQAYAKKLNHVIQLTPTTRPTKMPTTKDSLHYTRKPTYSPIVGSGRNINVLKALYNIYTDKAALEYMYAEGETNSNLKQNFIAKAQHDKEYADELKHVIDSRTE